MLRNKIWLILLLHPFLMVGQCEIKLDQIRNIKDESILIKALTNFIEDPNVQCDIKCLGKANQILAIKYYRNFEYNKSLFYAKKALELRRMINDTSGIISSLMMIYYGYQSNEMIDSAFYYINQIPIINDKDEAMIQYFEEKAYYSYISGDVYASRILDRQFVNWAKKMGDHALAIYSEINYLTSFIESTHKENISTIKNEIDSIADELTLIKSEISQDDYDLNLLSILYIKSIIALNQHNVTESLKIMRQLKNLKALDDYKWCKIYHFCLNNLIECDRIPAAKIGVAKLKKFIYEHEDMIEDEYFILQLQLLELGLYVKESKHVLAKNTILDIRNKLLNHMDFECNSFLLKNIEAKNPTQLLILIELYKYAAMILFDEYKLEGSRRLLHESLDYYLMSILLSNKFSSYARVEKSALLNQLQFEDIKKVALRTAISSQEYDYAFRISELCHSNYLENSINAQQYSKLLDQEKQSELITVKLKLNQISEELNQEMDPKKLNYLSQELNALKRKRDTLLVSDIHVDLDKQVQQSINKVMLRLKNKELIFEFISLDSSLFLFKLSKDGFCMNEIPRNNFFDSQVKLFSDGVSKATNINSADVKQASHFLHRSFFLDENLHDKKLIIIPNGVLWRVPFECLEDVSDAQNEGKMILYKAYVNYQFSCETFFGLERKQSKLTRFYGFAPLFQSKKSNGTSLEEDYEHLPNNVEECKTVTSLMGGISFVEDEATIPNFLSAIQKSGFLHLASHAFIDGTDHVNSYVVLSKEKSKHERLSLNQISALTMDAQQVVLSSCKSSAGILDNTEGILSLSRGFLLAGASSVISSLWSVNDKSTALIMENYYKYLVDGHSKSHALTYAKRKFILDYPEYAQPYYWAAFTLTGNTMPIYRGNSFTFWNN